jgi:cytochrome c oxidase subunit 2
VKCRVLALTVLGACSPARSMFATANDRADQIAGIGWVAMIGFSAAAVVMWILLGWAALRRRGSFESHRAVALDDGKGWLVIGGLVVPIIGFGGILAMSLARMHSAAPEPGHHESMEHMPGMAMAPSHEGADLRITGHRWWWEVQYFGATASETITSANEIHIPTGRDITIELASADVIHSFWVPRLQGKVDLIPGHVTEIVISADRPGRYDGQCGEFCGEQHAHMRLVVVAHTPADYEIWRVHELATAAAPKTEREQLGRQVFETASCALCHTIRGTQGHGTVGPDLTHFAERAMFAANSFPTNPGFLSAWLVHAQALKPAAQMPDLTTLAGDQLDALQAYLLGLR